MNTRLLGIQLGLIKQAGPAAQFIGRQLGKKPVIKALETSADKVMRLTGKGSGKVTAKAEKAVPTALQAAERRIAGQAAKAPVSRVAPSVAEVEKAFANMQRTGITPPNAAGMREVVGAPGSRALVPSAANAAERVGESAAKSRFGLGRLLTTLGVGGAAAGGYGMYKNMAQPGESTPAPTAGGTFISPPIFPTEERKQQVAAPMAGPVVGAPRAINPQVAPAPSPVTAAPVTAATAATAAKRKFNPFGLTAEQKARYRRETGTNFNPYSVADVNYFLNRFGDEATMSEAQADAAERARARGTAAQNAARLKQLTGQA